MDGGITRPKIKLLEQMNKILKKWNTENANKIDSITGIQGYFRKNWNTLYVLLYYYVVMVALISN